MRIHANLIHFLYINLLKKFLFLFDPELVHDRMTIYGKFLGKWKFTRSITQALFNYNNKKYLSQEILGLKFRNPIGLSAGFDKNAELVKILPSVGFSFMEVGSVTHKPYEGNPKPRLFRLIKSKGLVVYYGLKNIGVKAIAQKLKNILNPDFTLGISVAKTNCIETSTLKSGTQDYIDCLKVLEKEKIGDFYTINISCPNTFGGEPFTTPDKLEFLLKKVKKLKIQKPIFIKMPINLDWNEFNNLLKVAVRYQINGVVIGNLNKDHNSPLIKDTIPSEIKGGISGKPTYQLSNELISKTYKKYGGKLLIIGVGGIFNAEDAYEKIKRGASVLQLITGMIFEGPQLIGQINEELVDLLKRDNYQNISEAVGAYYN